MTARKRYRPRQANASSILAALYTRSTGTVSDHANEVVLHLYEALDAMKRGQATEHHFNALVTAANMAYVLAEKGVGAWFMDTCKRASLELYRVRQRHEITGVYGVSGQGIKDITAMIEARADQLTAEGYTEGLEYQAACIVADRLQRKVVITEKDLAEQSAMA